MWGSGSAAPLRELRILDDGSDIRGPNLEVHMEYSVVRITCDPDQPRSGARFYLRVELDRPAEKVDVTVRIEKQRIVQDLGGQPRLDGIGPGFFELVPGPVVVKVGERIGVSDPIEVKVDATALENGRNVEVHFPDQLLLSAANNAPLSESTGPYRSLVVIVLAPTNIA